MRPADIVSGLPFKTAAVVACGVLILIAVGGTVLTYTATKAFRGELREQTLEEVVLLRDIYNEQGRDGLVDAIARLDSFFDNQERVSGVFDENGERLVGPIAEMPDFVGLRETTFERITGERRDHDYVLSVERISGATIVVGRSLRSIEDNRDKLIAGLVILAVFITIGTLLLGVVASSRSFAKLRSIEDVLAHVARGQTDRRVPISAGRDQIDRISIQINRNLDRLSRLMDGLKATATAIAHDLKTPISHAQIALNRAADACEDNPSAQREIDAALRETGALTEIVDTVLRIARIRATSPQRDFMQQDLDQLVRNTIEFLSPLAEKNGQTMAFQPAPSGPVTLACDKSMVQQMLVNLLENSIVHAGEGADISVSIVDAGDQVDLIVRDTGPGIPEEERGRVLGSFERLDTTRSEPGSGLGLALVAAVADHHGAVLRLEDAGSGSKDRPGLRTTISFPKPQQ